MKNNQIKTIKSIKAKIEKSKTTIGKERDKLRELMSDLEDILDPIDSAEQDLQESLESLTRAIDNISGQM